MEKEWKLIEKLKQKLHKHDEIIWYIVFGVLTTMVNLIAFKYFNILLGYDKYLISNFIAWLIAVAFAYFTNKIFVFKISDWNIYVVAREILAFVIARVVSFFIEEFGLIIFIEILELDKFEIAILDIHISGVMTVKLSLAVIVVILNYVFSKFFIFKKKSEK